MTHAEANAAAYRISTGQATEQDERNLLSALRGTLVVAQHHLRQYRDYSERMRAHGRGFTPSDPFSPEYLDGMIAHVLKREA